MVVRTRHASRYLQPLNTEGGGHTRVSWLRGASRRDDVSCVVMAVERSGKGEEETIESGPAAESFWTWVHFAQLR